ncbi:DNA-binding NarL/FixJ family response regulator [Streptomyces capillispiralis]|uniref:DNA-binding NarL/FixJ family response regulator n=2 Tax=Streptomyces capillispiralis TaxID=68182 RepID=A0A561TGP9_9ACTN|nr:DNA-binding NarL/FixJ family response regulator [Streptomyces capillispiralis]
MFRAGVRLELERTHDLELAGEAATEEEAVRELHGGSRPVPDVIVADFPLSRIREGDFVRTVGRLSEANAARLLVVSITESDEAVIAAMSAGARGFLGKTVPREHFLLAIRLVAAGGAVFGPAIAQRMQSYFSAFGDLPEQSGFSQLTLREREVLDLLARGCGNREIARRLFLAEKTVRNHVSHIFAKLNVSDRSMAVVLARNAGIGA